ncbi:Pycsar system effector family protein [uncultured Maribacter sp.]|uniref:Pycsar system effector family protein n=1 Tax=uncultured Maribacter sp. TaxID=431308 RepID=UPI0030D8E5EF
MDRILFAKQIQYPKIFNATFTTWNMTKKEIKKQSNKEHISKKDYEKFKLIKGESSHTEELVDHYWGSINYVFSLIKASEIKAGLILSFYGILLNIIYGSIVTVLQKDDNTWLIYILIMSWVISTIISIYYSIRCFIPKIEDTYDPNIFFFGDIISKFGTIREFSQTFYNISLTEEELFDHLGQQVFINSKISAYKFKCVNYAIRFLAIGLAILFLTVLCYVFTEFILK